MFKYRKILNHAKKMVNLYKKSYLFLSVTVSLSIGILLVFLLTFDSIKFNEFKEIKRYPENIAQMMMQDDDYNERYFLNYLKSKNIALNEWYTSDTTLDMYQKKNEILTAHVYLTNRNFFNYPVYHEAFEKPEILEGRLYSNKEIENKSRVVVIDQVFAKALNKENIVGTTIRLPLKKSDGNYYLDDFKIIGVVKKRNDRIVNVTSENIMIHQIDLYLPYTLKDQIYTDSNPITKNITIISENMRAIAKQAMQYKVGINSVASFHDDMYKKSKDNAIVKSIILIVIVIILNVNMFSTLNNLIAKRKKEIGIMRALGIKKVDIMIQFFFELFYVLLINIIIISSIIILIFYIITQIISFKTGADYIMYMEPLSIVLYLSISFMLIMSNAFCTSYLTTRIDILENIKAE